MGRQPAAARSGPGCHALALLALLLTPALEAEAVGCRAVAPRSTAELTAPGPFAVGVTTRTFVDSSRPTPPNGSFPGAASRTLVTEVWYPATVPGRDAPPEPSLAAVPVIVHSHGFLDSRLGESFLTEHLASRGYVVAAPDYPLSHGGAPGGATVADVPEQPGDWSFVLDAVLGAFPSLADPGRVGASGLSLGGLTTLLVTYHPELRDPRIGAALPMAGPGCFFGRRFFRTTSTPLLVLHGDSDLIVPFKENALRVFRRARGPKLLVRLRDGSHTGFSVFAPLFDPSQHFDAIGCAALTGGLGDGIPSDPNANPFEALGGREQGILLDPRLCPLPCEAPVPVTPSMGAARHHELTRAVATAFFDAYLRSDESARCFLRSGLARESPDVAVRRRGLLRGR
ncbi:MAG: alpha/beta hydrolase family protein [Myxococcota bacterium]